MAVLKGDSNLIPSENSWDWLGHGIYFWEDNPRRGFEYASEVSAGVQKNKKGIKNPFVLGAIIELGKCLNLLSDESNPILSNSYLSMKEKYDVLGKEMPKNTKNNRALDCSVILSAVEAIKQLKGVENIDTVRGAFDEGKELYPGTTFTERQHIQVCVLNPEVIKGYFIPRPLSDFNPTHFSISQ